MANRKHQGPAERWVEEGSGSGIDAELGEVFRTIIDEAPLSDVALARVGRRLASPGKRRARQLFRLVPVGLAVLVGGSGAALAQWAKPGIWDTRTWFVTQHQPAPPRAPRATPPRAPAAEITQAVPQAAVQLPPSEPARPLGSGAARPSDIALESELLERALATLRRDHDGVTALTLLDEHRARFPSGVLALEAAVARVDALLLLGRRAEALQQLSSLPLERVGRRIELQLLRAELNAERDCRKALADFSAVLGSTAPDALSERALYGRATCRLRLGDGAGGSADLESYLARFPRGRFAPQIRARAASTGSF